MPRIGGSEAYYYEIQLEMDREDTDMRTAEIEILYRVIKAMRFQEGKTHKEIQEYLEETWGLKRGAYHRRLQRIREQYVLP